MHFHRPWDCCVPLIDPIILQYKHDRIPPLLRAGQWSPILLWQGVTWRTLTFQARIMSPDKDAAVAWRRWGGAIVPFSSGVFKGQSLFHVYPGDLFFRVDVMPVQGDVELTIEPLDP